MPFPWEDHPRTSLCWRSVVPLVELASDELCLSAHTNQNSGRSALERGDHRLGLRNGKIEPRPAGHTMQFHIYQILGADRFLGAHDTPLAVCGAPSARPRASLSRPCCSRSFLPGQGAGRANLLGTVLHGIPSSSLIMPTMPVMPVPICCVPSSSPSFQEEYLLEALLDGLVARSPIGQQHVLIEQAGLLRAIFLIAHS